MTLPNVAHIRDEFRRLRDTGTFVKDKTGCNLIEIRGVSFIADEPSIFGRVDLDWCARELQWYQSQSLSVNDIPAPIPQIWLQVSSKCGQNRINSNYGWCIWSEANCSQYARCLRQLLDDANSRRATMIYTRPSMQTDYNRDGMSDFMCTNAVQYLIRDGEMSAYVSMRANDAVFGYKGDRCFQQHVLRKLVADYNERTGAAIIPGQIIWQPVSIHVYERHFRFV